MPQVHHIPLTITEDYAPSWKYWDGIREIVQNWYDGLHDCALTKLGIEVSYDKNLVQFEQREVDESQTPRQIYTAVTIHPEPPFQKFELGELWYVQENDRVSLINHCTSLHKRILLLGYSQKTEPRQPASKRRREVIGQFGEGLKVGALALVREGRLVTLETSEDRWRFEIKENQEFEERVLTVSTMKRSLKENGNEEVFSEMKFPPCPVDLLSDDTCTTVSPISNNEWNESLGKFLFLKKPETEVRTTFGRILLDEANRGQLYVKGVWVADYREDNLYAGVDFRNMDLDRDRRTISRPAEIDHYVSQMWVEAVGKQPRLAPDYYRLIKQSKHRDVKHAADYATKDKDVCKLVSEEFQKDHESEHNVFATSNTSLQQELDLIRNELQKTVVLCNENLLKILYESGQHLTLKEAIDQHKEVVPVKAKHEYIQPNNEEQRVLNEATTLARMALPGFAIKTNVFETNKYENAAWHEESQSFHVPHWMLVADHVHKRGKLCPDNTPANKCKCREILLCIRFVSIMRAVIGRPPKRLEGFEGDLPPSYDLPIMHQLSQLAAQACSAAPVYCKSHQGRNEEEDELHQQCKERQAYKNNRITELQDRLDEEAHNSQEKLENIERKMEMAKRELQERKLKFEGSTDEIAAEYEKQLSNVKHELKEVEDSIRIEVNSLRSRSEELQGKFDKSETTRQHDEETLEGIRVGWDQREKVHFDEVSKFIESIRTRNTTLKECVQLSQESSKYHLLDKLYSVLEREEKKDCAICKESKKNILFKECRHFLCCESCANKERVCPQCKTDIQEGHMIKIYI